MRMNLDGKMVALKFTVPDRVCPECGKRKHLKEGDHVRHGTLFRHPNRKYGIVCGECKAYFSFKNGNLRFEGHL